MLKSLLSLCVLSSASLFVSAAAHASALPELQEDFEYSQEVPDAELASMRGGFANAAWPMIDMSFIARITAATADLGDTITKQVQESIYHINASTITDALNNKTNSNISQPANNAPEIVTITPVIPDPTQPEIPTAGVNIPQLAQDAAVRSLVIQNNASNIAFEINRTVSLNISQFSFDQNLAANAQARVMDNLNSALVNAAH